MNIKKCVHSTPRFPFAFFLFCFLSNVARVFGCRRQFMSMFQSYLITFYIFNVQLEKKEKYLQVYCKHLRHSLDEELEFFKRIRSCTQSPVGLSICNLIPIFLVLMKLFSIEIAPFANAIGLDATTTLYLPTLGDLGYIK